MADNPERDGKSTCHPCVVGVLGVHVTLDNLIALAKAVIHFHQELRMYEIVRIENADSVIFLVHFEQPVKHPVEGIALALFGRMGALVNNGSGFCCHFGGIVIAVIRYHMNIIHILGIVELA